MMEQKSEFWRERMTIPAYRVGEAASYVKISPSTVAAWHKSRTDSKSALGVKEKGSGLSFLQLIELAVVAEMRRIGLKLPEIRHARQYFSEKFATEYPFAELKFKTDGADILQDVTDDFGKWSKDKLLAANHGGQLVWSEVISNQFKEFNYDENGSVSSWKVAGEDRNIVIDPRLAFGAPQVRGVKTSIIKDRWSANETIDEICEDFELEANLVLEALVFEGITVSKDQIH